MSFLVRRFILFVCVLFVLFLTSFVSYRCGRSQGLKDAPRHFYSADVASALKENPDFRHYVDSLYVSTYSRIVSEFIATDKGQALVREWVMSHPACASEVRNMHRPMSSDEFMSFFVSRQKK